MKNIPHMYWMSLFGIAAAIFFLSRFLWGLIRSRKRKLFIGLTAVLLAALVCIGSPYLLDLPCLFTGELETVSGYVVGHDSAGREDVYESRGITIETESGQRIKLLVVYTPIYQGDYLQVNCLPHCGIGYIVERNAECKMHNAE